MKFYGDYARDSHDNYFYLYFYYFHESYNYFCLAVVLIDFVLKKDGSHYLQVFLKVHWKRKKVIRNIADGLEIFSDDSNKE